MVRESLKEFSYDSDLIIEEIARETKEFFVYEVGDCSVLTDVYDESLLIRTLIIKHRFGGEYKFIFEHKNEMELQTKISLQVRLRFALSLRWSKVSDILLDWAELLDIDHTEFDRKSYLIFLLALILIVTLALLFLLPAVFY